MNIVFSKIVALCFMIIRHGRLKHSGYDYNKTRMTSLAKLKEFIPKGDFLKPAHSGKLKSWLMKNPVTRNLISQAAFARKSFIKQGGSLYSPVLNLTYIRVPKSGSTSISYIILNSIYKNISTQKLDSFEINFLTDAHLRYEIPANPTSEILFTAVRNPFSRIVSVYRDFFEKSSNNFIYQDYLFGVLDQKISFKEFVQRIEAIPDRLKDQHLKPQYYFLEPYLKRNSHIVVLKLERPEELNSFLNIYNLEMPHLNESGNQYDYKSYYDLETFRKVRRLYRKDIHKFQYQSDVKILEDFLKKE